MAKRPVRFIHAGDFHLERPVHGLSEAHDHLRWRLVEAPFAAATRVFDAAVAESVDFVVLSGDLVQVDLVGPRGATFLVEQFERLARGGIEVFWATGQVDAGETWPRQIRLPANVHVFSDVEPSETIVRRADEPLARLVGGSRASNRRLRPSDFACGASGLFTIGVAYGRFDRAALEQSEHIDYWALGGLHRRDTVVSAPLVAHYAGTPQGRHADELGPHGATLVRVDASGAPHLSFVPCDALRWHAERIVVDAHTTRESLARTMAERLADLLAAHPGVDFLVRWTVACDSALKSPLARGTLAAELLAQLRHDFANRPQWAWSASLEVEPPARLNDAWHDEDSILGEFLRAVGDRQQAASTGELCDLALNEYLGEPLASSILAEAVRLDDETTRTRVLRKAAVLGADLLAGEETLA